MEAPCQGPGDGAHLIAVLPERTPRTELFARTLAWTLTLRQPEYLLMLDASLDLKCMKKSLIQMILWPMNM